MADGLVEVGESGVAPHALVCCGEGGEGAPKSVPRGKGVDDVVGQTCVCFETHVA